MLGTILSFPYVFMRGVKEAEGQTYQYRLDGSERATAILLMTRFHG